MKAIDLQCQMVTKWGSFLPLEMVSQFEKYLGTKLGYGKTDEEMAQVLRDADVKAIARLSFRKTIRTLYWGFGAQSIRSLVIRVCVKLRGVLRTWDLWDIT